MKVCVTGSQNFTDYNLMAEVLDAILANRHPNITIISGKARGADRLGEIYAKSKGYSVLQFPAEWEKYGRNAGFKRNALMVSHADVCVIFWDGKSKVTQHMISLCEKQNVPFVLINYV